MIESEEWRQRQVFQIRDLLEQLGKLNDQGLKIAQTRHISPAYSEAIREALDAITREREKIKMQIKEIAFNVLTNDFLRDQVPVAEVKT